MESVTGVDLLAMFTIKEWLILAKMAEIAKTHELMYLPEFMGETKIIIANQEIYALKGRMQKLVETLRERAAAAEKSPTQVGTGV